MLSRLGGLCALGLIVAWLPAKAAEPSQYTITLTPAQLETVLTALGKQPFSDVQALMTVFNQQIMQQRALANMPPPTAPAVPPPTTPGDAPKP